MKSTPLLFTRTPPFRKAFSVSRSVGFLLVAAGLALTLSTALPSEAFAKKTQKTKIETISATQTLFVPVDQGVSVKLPAPAASVFIASPEIADIQVLSPSSIMVFGKKMGETTLMATDEKGTTLLKRSVHVDQDLGPLRSALNAVIPHNNIRVKAVPNGIVLTGTANDTSAIDDARRLAARYLPKDGEIINRIRMKGSTQINIRVRFAEVSRDVDKVLGFNWETVGKIGGFDFGIASGATVVSNGVNLLNRYRPTTSGSVSDIMSLSRSGKSFSFNTLLDALETDGLVTILAEPNLTAMSGETASFLAGGEFPIPVPQNQNTISIEWKEYGVSLAFTPTLIGDNRISLHVRPEVSQLSETGAITLDSVSIPALTTRRAETTVELSSGQSFAIGGLLNNSQSQSIEKYPFLGDIPVLGALFRSNRFQNSQSELVIIITPYLVKPTEREQLAMPTDGFTAPNDADRYGRNRMTNSSPQGRPMSGEPRATVLQNEIAPTPDAAPISAVQQTSEPVSAAAKMRAKPVKTTEPVLVNPTNDAASTAPQASGGFILE